MRSGQADHHVCWIYSNLFMVTLFWGQGLLQIYHVFKVALSSPSFSHWYPCTNWQQKYLFSAFHLPAPTSPNIRLFFSMFFLSFVLHGVVSTEGNSDASTALALLTNASPDTRWDHVSPLTPPAVVVSVTRSHQADEHTQGLLFFTYFQLVSTQFITEFFTTDVTDYQHTAWYVSLRFCCLGSEDHPVLSMWCLRLHSFLLNLLKLLNFSPFSFALLESKLTVKLLITHHYNQLRLRNQRCLFVNSCLCVCA